MGPKISLEEHSIRIRPIFPTMVFTFHSAFAENEIRKLPLQRVKQCAGRLSGPITICFATIFRCWQICEISIYLSMFVRLNKLVSFAPILIKNQ